MPKLAAFPKAFMDALCLDGSMTLVRWVEMAAGLDIDGLEFYAGFLDLQNPNGWSLYRRIEKRMGWWSRCSAAHRISATRIPSSEEDRLSRRSAGSI